MTAQLWYTVLIIFPLIRITGQMSIGRKRAMYMLDAGSLLFCNEHWFQLRLKVMYRRLLKTSTSNAAYFMK